MVSKKIVLVFPRFKYPSGDFSLGLAYLAGYLREKIKDLEIKILDTTFNPNWNYVVSFIKKEKPSIVGIYTDTLMFNDAIKVAKIAKKYGSHVILGGPHPTVMPEHTIENKYVDAICIGEGELTFEEYVKKFFSKNKLDGIKGIWFKKDNQIVKNPKRNLLISLDNLPMPAYDLFDMKQYLRKFVQLDSYNPHIKGISIIASRGCPYNCSYCQPTLKEIFGKRLRIEPPIKIIKQLKYLKNHYGIKAFYFQDDTFTVLKKWVNEFCDLLVKEDLKLLWCCNTRADTVNFELLEKMKKSGLVKIKVGIESITDRIRNGIYKKNITNKQIYGLLHNSKKLGIQVTGFFMLGAPTETKREILRTIKFAANSSLIEANFSITTALPKTNLYDYVKEHDWVLPERFENFDYYQVNRPQMSKEEVSVNTLKFYKKIANFYFYLHPHRAFNTIKSIWGIDGLKKLFLKIRRI